MFYFLTFWAVSRETLYALFFSFFSSAHNFSIMVLCVPQCFVCMVGNWHRTNWDGQQILRNFWWVVVRPCLFHIPWLPNMTLYLTCTLSILSILNACSVHQFPTCICTDITSSGLWALNNKNGPAKINTFHVFCYGSAPLPTCVAHMGSPSYFFVSTYHICNSATQRMTMVMLLQF